MKLSELIAQLVGLAEELNERDVDWESGDWAHEGFDVDPEVRIATQPSYPLAHSICCVNHIPCGWDEETGIVWIAEGSSCYDSPYAPRAAWGE